MISISPQGVQFIKRHKKHRHLKEAQSPFSFSKPARINVIMPSRVTPFQASFIGNQEILTSAVTAPSVTNDVPFNVESQEQENADERFLKAVEDVYSPLLRAMKSFGIYFGDVALEHFTDTSSPVRKRNILARIYCCVLISCFWLNCILTLTAMIFENDIYLVLMMSFWCLFIALNATISLVVLPITGGKKSRLEKCLSCLLASVKMINLEKVKKNSRTALAVFCLLFIVSAAGVIAGALFLDGFNMGTFTPWHRWFGFRVFAPTFLIIGIGSWLLPIIFFCITSLMLETIFEDLHRRMLLSHSTPMDLTALKIEYHKLVKVVELADKVLAPLLLVFVSVYIPLLCFSFYNVAKPHDRDSQMLFLLNLFWFLLAAATLAVVLVFGSKDGEKVQP